MKVILGLHIPEPTVIDTMISRQSGKTQRNTIIAEIYKKQYGTVKRNHRTITKRLS